ncbi:MAG: 2-amino-4-hydroxy-6-hydroxymethyldihydropteridine diphosphokinase [Dehalococcoidia bacterium]|jgi:2-amino-4-hydroxy-6-hydroxymethyldihydropteridine diphosphokinase
MSGVGVYLSLGANLGNRTANLRLALRYLSSLAPAQEVSSLYETDPVGSADQPAFYNAVCRVATGLTPEALQKYLKSVEFEIGRRPAPHWAARPIDLDLLLYGQRLIDVPDLTVPHPRLAERAFVLVPLAEIAPDLRHPVLGRSIAEIAASLPEGDLTGVRRIAPLGWQESPEREEPPGEGGPC